MILSDGEIIGLHDSGKLGIDPFTVDNVQSASYDITLGDTFSVIDCHSSVIIEPEKKYDYRTVKAYRYIIYPGQFVLATTREYIKLPNNLTAFVEGRSSWGRLGLFIQNAGWVDPGFEGEITLELFNANKCPIELEKGMRIGQLVFAKMEKDALYPYCGKYQGQRNATGSRVFKDFER